MHSIKVGEKNSALIDQDSQIYTWGTDSSKKMGSNMPQLVEALSMKVVTQVACGLDFVVALGQDFNEYG